MKNGWLRRPLVPEILGHTDSVPSKTPIWNRFSLVAPSDKVQSSLIWSLLHAFHWA